MEKISTQRQGILYNVAMVRRQLILIKAHLFIFIVDILNEGDQIKKSFIYVVMLPIHSFSLNFSLSTLLLFRLFLSMGSVDLFSSCDQIVPWPLISGDPSCHHRGLPCAYP